MAMTPTSAAGSRRGAPDRMARMKTVTCSMRVSRRRASIVMSSPDDRAKNTVAPQPVLLQPLHQARSPDRETQSGSSDSRVSRRTSVR